MNNIKKSTAYTNIKLVSFSDDKIKRSLSNLEVDAIKSGFFNDICLYHEKDLPDWLLQRKTDRGFGYWSWKPYILNETISQSKLGDIIVYLDAGCRINNNGREIFDIYKFILDKFDILLFDQPYLEREWTKKEIYRYFNLVPDNSTQYSAGSFAFRITKQTIQLIDEWNKLSKNAYDLFTDHSRLKQLPEFKENRHDQSIFSILIKISNINKFIIPVTREIIEPHLIHNFIIEESKFPFLSLRQKDHKINMKIFVSFHSAPFENYKCDYFEYIQVAKQTTLKNYNTLSDDTLTNISNKNNWAEFTVIYWVWKNIHNLDYVGINTYRKPFQIKIEDYADILTNNDLICFQNASDESFAKGNIKSQLLSCFDDVTNCDIFEETFRCFHPEEYDDFIQWFHEENIFIPCNSFVMKYDDFNRYCEWMFPMLFELDKTLTFQDERIIGHYGERLTAYYLLRKFKKKFQIEKNEYEKIRINGEKDELAAQLYRLQQEINLMKNSKSWRLTVPLRFISRFYRDGFLKEDK
jgi:hypothetical protein